MRLLTKYRNHSTDELIREIENKNLNKDPRIEELMLRLGDLEDISEVQEIELDHLKLAVFSLLPKLYKFKGCQMDWADRTREAVLGDDAYAALSCIDQYIQELIAWAFNLQDAKNGVHSQTHTLYNHVNTYGTDA